MDTSRQEPLEGAPLPRRRRVWCRGWGCGRELFDLESRRRGYGPECDPDQRTAARAHEVDQEPLPGL